MAIEMVKTALQDKRVTVKVGKYTHTGVVLGEDKIFKDTILVGVTSTTIPGVTLKNGQRYISVYRAKPSQLKVI